MPKPKFGAAVEKSLHGLGGVHVLIAHEPARLIGANREHREPEWTIAVARRVKVIAVAIT